MLDRAGRRETKAAQTVGASLRFARGGGRTFIQRQRVPYPFHITRPHFLDADCPDLATLILQSASGGLYRGDRLTLDVSAGPGARAHLRSQAATVVHAAREADIALDVRLAAEPGAFLALTNEPYILFPGTALSVRTDVTLDAAAGMIVTDGFATHDPAGAHAAFRRLATRCRVRSSDGTLLVDEASAIDGADFFGPGSPLGPYRAFGTVLLLGEAAARLPAARAAGSVDNTPGVLGGATTLPNGAGVCVRLLAAGGGQLARGMDVVSQASFAALLGGSPPRRR